VLFDYSWEHVVVNPSSEPRVVLMVDVRRPMGWVADQVNRFVTHQIVRRVYAPKVLANLPSVEVELKEGAEAAQQRPAEGAEATSPGVRV
jgi:aspartate beta-hydroxylase/beta-hydroxylase